MVGDVWQDLIDVPEINKGITEAIYRAIEVVRVQKVNRIVLVLGEPGSGKTHVLARIQRQAEASHQFLFVYITPLGDIEKINQHVLREVIISLMKQVGQRPLTPLLQYTTVLLSRVLLDLKRQGKLPPKYHSYINVLARGADPIEVFHNEIQRMAKEDRDQLGDLAISSITQNHPQVDASFLRVLFHLLDGSRRPWAQEWLKGVDLPEEDLTKLQVTHSLDSEERAGEVLQSIFTLAQGPIVLCVDQLESVYERFKDRDGMKLLFDQLMNYYNQFRNLMVIIACNSMYWSESIQGSISQAAQDRISIKASLRSLSNEEAKLLVSKRMQGIWQNYPGTIPYPTYPFREEYIYEVARKCGWNPRGIIKQMREAFLQVQEGVVAELVPARGAGGTRPGGPPMTTARPADLGAEFQEKVETLSREIYKNEISGGRSPGWEDQLTGFLTDLFKECYTKRIQVLDGTMTKWIANLRKTRSQKPLSFLVEIAGERAENGKPRIKSYVLHVTNTTNGSSLASALKRMKEYLEENPTWEGVLIRSEKLTLEGRYPAAHRVLEELPGRLRISYWSDHQISQVLALKRLLEAATGGELYMQDRLMTRAEVMQLILAYVNQWGAFWTMVRAGEGARGSPGVEDLKPAELAVLGGTNAREVTSAQGLPGKEESAPRPPLPADQALFEKVRTIARSKAVINVTDLGKELGMDLMEVTELCHRMASKNLITILRMEPESGFLIAATPAKPVL